MAIEKIKGWKRVTLFRCSLCPGLLVPAEDREQHDAEWHPDGKPGEYDEPQADAIPLIINTEDGQEHVIPDPPAPQVPMLDPSKLPGEQAL